MEFPDLGKQCCFSLCKQLDFIPLKCLCQKFFCKDHFLEHCLSGVCEHYRNNEPNFTENSPLFRCNSDKCSSSSYIELPCPKCLKHFCIEHRFHPECPEIDPEVLKTEKERWAQPRAMYEKAKAHVEAEVTRKLGINQLSMCDAKAKTALKVQLMKLKSKAKGETTTPSTDRIYFLVAKPIDATAKVLVSNPEESKNKTNNEPGIPVFVSKDWSLGRVIDSISNTCCVKNDNNKPKVPKLRLFRESDGLCLNINKMESKLSELLSSEIILNGMNIVLEYTNVDGLLVDEVYFLVR